jgi:hypothetical protein
MPRYFNPLSRIFSLLETILANQQKERTLLSNLSDAVSALTAANAAEHQELQFVLAAVSEFPAKVKAAVDQAIADGASPELLAGIKAVADQQTADAQAMADALASPPPAPVG